MSALTLIFFTVVSLLVTTACVRLHPIAIDSDPNQERLERLQEKTEQENIEVFIAEHPNLDDDTRRELREGTISRNEALKRSQKTTPTK